MQNSRDKAGAAGALKKGVAALKAELAEGGAKDFHLRHSDFLDAYFVARLAEIWPKGSGAPEDKPFAVLAVGGYGRRELCPYSDVDILVVYERKIPTEALDLAQSLLVPLWDMGYDLGHGFRSIKDCVRLSKDDFQVMASLLDARLVAGNTKVFDLFGEKLQQAVRKKKKKFIAFLDHSGGPAQNTADDEGFLLEPDLKNGRGGLRDYHRILWLGRVRYGTGSIGGLLKRGKISEAQAQAILDLSGFLLGIRNRLHLIAGRRNDKLHFDYQKRLAEELGFEERDGSLPVERFLAALHRNMAGLHALLGSFRSQIEMEGEAGKVKSVRLAPGVVRRGSELAFDLPRDYPDEPMVLMNIFERSAETGLLLDWNARRLVSGHLYLVESSLSGSREAARAFQRILLSGWAFQTLEQMRETGFLGAFLPEFGRVQDLVQFDTYHLHPVGRHTLMAIGRLEGLDRDEDVRFSPVWRRVKDRLRLIWAAFFHDIGKGLGGGHGDKGAAIARRSLVPFELPEEAVQDVEFLVREHLLMPETAERRDLDDESQVASVAGVIGGLERLDMLYLLTYADARATGPKAWSDWRASLVTELYDKVRRILEQGALASPHAVQKALRTRDALRRKARDLMDPETLENYLEKMPARYALTMEPDEIFGHLELAARLEGALEEDSRRKPSDKAGKGVIIFETEPKGEAGRWRMTLAAKDSPALFSTICGVMALHDMNIVFAECFLWGDGTVIDRFTVTDLPEFLSPEDAWDRVGYSVRAALTGKLSLDYRLDEKRKSPLTRKSLTIEPDVSLDNKTSDFYTLIEIRAPDRVGLLYDVSHAMLDLGLVIHLSKIATYGDQVQDVFYVRDSLGRKIEKEQIPDIKSALLRSLSF